MIATPSLLDQLAEAAQEAGEAILEVRRRGFDIETKPDRSPVTEADRAAERIILAALERVAPNVPVIAEEEVAAGRIPAHGGTFFLVDPLDGTKDFVRGGGEYTVNIGLIEQGRPSLGVIFTPEQKMVHAGLAGAGAWCDGGSGRLSIATRGASVPLTSLESKSHFNQATADYLQQALPASERVAVGSSLKFCILAEGRADIYPRLSPTSEWDIAAGHAIVLAAGGRVDGPDGNGLRYGKPAFFNRGFVATGGWPAPSLAPFLQDFAGGGDLPQGV